MLASCLEIAEATGVEWQDMGNKHEKSCFTTLFRLSARACHLVLHVDFCSGLKASRLQLEVDDSSLGGDFCLHTRQILEEYFALSMRSAHAA